MRNILHDYSDQKCLVILKHLIAAMNIDSVILIDDMILPNQGINWHQGQMDMAMMCGLASVERSRGQWEHLLDSAALKIEKTFVYTEDL